QEDNSKEKEYGGDLPYRHRPPAVRLRRPPRARRPRPADALRVDGRAQGGDLPGRPGRGARPARPPRRRKDDHDRDPRRLPDALRGTGERAGGRPRPRRRALALPARRGPAVLARPRQVAGRRTAGALRPVLPPLLHGRDQSATRHRGTARHRGPGRACQQAGQDALRGPAPPTRRRDRHRRPSRTALPRRADRRVRPRGPPGLPRPGAPPGRPGGHHRPAHHARPGRGGETGRPHPHPRGRPDRRRRQRGPTLPAGEPQDRDPLDPRRPAVRALRRRRHRVRPRTVRPVRRGDRRPGGTPRHVGGRLHGHGAPARVRCRGRRRARVWRGEPVNTMLFALRLGLLRGWAEFRQTLTILSELGSYLLNSVIFVAVLLFMDGNEMENTALFGTGITQATLAMPGVLATMLVFGGIVSMAQLLSTDREDGTLLRAKALPRGTQGYLVGKVVSVSLITLLSMLVILVPAVLLIDGFQFTVQGSLTLLWVTALGLLATLPAGAILGSLFTNPRAIVGVLVLLLMGLMMVSGIFFPISMLPEWLHWVAQVFPIYWLGLGMRSGL